MIIRNSLLVSIFILMISRSLDGLSLAEQCKQVGYSEICNHYHGAVAFDSLYTYFDQFIEFLQAHQSWTQKLYAAKEQFIRSKERDYYSTNFFGFYDESKIIKRHQISFYYSSHFHKFICSRYPEFNKALPIIHFFDACYELQKSYGTLAGQVAAELELESLFSSLYGHPPLLLKVIKYLPSYSATKPHYDGTAFSLFLDSTDTESLLLAPYRSSYTIDNFSSPSRKFSRENNQNSLIIIPGTLLTEFSLYPTPHIVINSGKTRYATIAFTMRPDHIPEKIELPPLPIFNA